MKRLAITLLVVPFVGLAACGGDSPADNGDNQTAQNDNSTNDDTDNTGNDGSNQSSNDGSNQSSNDGSNQSSNDGSNQSSNDGDGGVDSTTADTAGSVMREHYAMENEFNDAVCECAWEDQEQDYSSANDCMDDRIVSDSELDDLETCYRDAVLEYDKEAPTAIHNLFDCYQVNQTDAQDCIQGVEDSYENLCSDDAFGELTTCGAEFQDGGGTCEDELEGEAKSWLDTVNSLATDNGCFENTN